MPIRTCVGCRQPAEQAELVRLALSDAGVTLSRTAPGRGAWLHAGRGCGALALKRRAIGRALRAELSDPAALQAVIAAIDTDVHS